jgi:hypothetical protein
MVDRGSDRLWDSLSTSIALLVLIRCIVIPLMWPAMCGYLTYVERRYIG